MNAPKAIYYVSAPCGAGKTTAAVGYIKENIRNRNFVVVVPTVLMVEQWSKALSDNGIVAEAITSSSCGMNVKKIIIDHQNKFKPQGHVQVITWNAYAELPFRPQHKNIQVVIDEVPTTDRFFPWNIAGHIDELANVVTVERPVNDRLSIVRATNVHELECELSAPGDDVDVLFDEFKRHLRSPYRTVYVDAAAYERVFNKREISRDSRDYNRVSFLSMLNSHLLEEAILLGANIETSILYKWMIKMHDAKFVEHLEISRRLKPQFSKGQHLKILYFLGGDTLASKYRFDCATATGARVIDEMDRHALELFDDEQFLFVTNNKRRTQRLEECVRATPLRVDSRGLNSYISYDNIYFSAALNREPQHIRMLEDLGLASKDVYRATTCEQAYQSIFRTSLRDHRSDRVVTAIVPDLTTATYIAELVGGADIRSIDIQHAQKANALTQTQKKQRMRAKKSLDRLLASKCLPYSSLKETGGQNVANNYSSTPPEKRGELAALVEAEIDFTSDSLAEESNKFACSVTFHDKLQAFEERDHKVISITPMEFVRLLRTQSLSVQDAKCGRTLFNAGVYKRTEGSTGWRTLANFQSSSMMVLDFDDGNLSPEEFCTIFGGDGGSSRRLNFAIYNSFSRSPEQPNRFHVVIFYRRPAQSIEEHRAVFDGIVRRLEDEGFDARYTGLDRASATGVQSFYLPATNRAYPEMAFFQVHGVTAREMEKAIDPSFYARTTIASEPQGVRSPNSNGRSVIVVEDILTPLRGLTCDRHKRLFQAAVDMQRRGLTLSEIEAKLSEAFGAEPKIRKKIRDASNSLVRYGRVNSRRTLAHANNAPS